MAEHYTQGRQGQGARRRRNNKGRPYRRRMPRQEQPAPKPGLLQRILNFFGFGKKKDAAQKENHKNDKRKPKEKGKEERSCHDGLFRPMIHASLYVLSTIGLRPGIVRISSLPILKIP